MKLHCEVDRYDERVFVRFFWRQLSAGVLMFAPARRGSQDFTAQQVWERLLTALTLVFEVEVDEVDHLNGEVLETLKGD